jgi:hypothetical protein
MNRQRVDDDWPILEFYFDEVADEMERPLTAAKRKVSRRAVLETFRETRSMRLTAQKHRVATACVNGILHRAFISAKRMTGIRPNRQRG